MNAMPSIHLRRLAALVALGLGSAIPAGPAYACGENAVIGSVCAFAGSFCPVGYLPANGGTFTTQYYQSLFDVLGNAFSPSPAPTGQFSVPNMLGNAAIGATDSGPVLGASVGVAATTLTLSQMPAHSHNINWPIVGGGLITSGYVPINTAPATLPPSLDAGATVYLTSATAGGGISSLKGLYTTQAPGATNTTLAPLAFSNRNADISLTGSTVVAGGQLPFQIQSPAQGVTYCIAVSGSD
jgi:microcystin-dependent protein